MYLDAKHDPGPQVAPQSSGLVALAEGRRFLAEARDLLAVLDLRDKALAVEHYLRQCSDSIAAAMDAAELRLRAERRLGELLAETVKRGGNCHGGSSAPLPESISHNQSSRYQRAARVEEAAFEDLVGRARERGDLRMMTSAAVRRLAIEAAKKDDLEALASFPGCTVDDLHDLVRAGKKFGTIYADPPWAYDNQSTRAATDNHYPTMSVEDIAALPVGELAAECCHLHLWTTNAFLRDGLDLLASWGFDYQGVFVWCKPQIGIGNCWRVSHEFLLLAIRGEPRTFRVHDLRSWEAIDRGRHSAKPEQVRLNIEKASPGPYLELFGRMAVPGWTVWGNQVSRDLFTQEIPNGVN